MVIGRGCRTRLACRAGFFLVAKRPGISRERRLEQDVGEVCFLSLQRAGEGSESSDYSRPERVLVP